MNNTGLKGVLLVDDDGSSNMINKLFIEGLSPDLVIDTVIDGYRALDVIEGNINEIIGKAFLLMLDIEMPKMDGWQFLQAINILFTTDE